MVQRSNQDRSDEISKLITAWIASRDSLGDYEPWIQTKGPTAFKGVKRRELAALLGVSKTALNENKSSPELRNAEYRWCREYIRKLETSQSITSEARRAREGEKRANKKASVLEGNNLELAAENRLLRARLAKWEAIDKILLETARAPRGTLSDV